MKKLAIAVGALLVLVAFAGWNVWHAVYEPVTSRPSLVEEGRQQLHAQLEQAKTHEAEIEKQDWDTISLLRELIQAHQHRIDQLKDNGQAGEILAHDRDAIVRIEKRIADLQAQQAAEPLAQSSDTAGDSSQPVSSTPSAAPHPTAPQTTKPAQKTQPAAPGSPKPVSKPAPQALPQTH